MQVMRATGTYFICAGVAEIGCVCARQWIPFMLLPHAGLLWLSVFVEFGPRALLMALLLGLLTSAAGVSVLVGKYTRVALLAIGLISGLAAYFDLYLPIAVLFSGGADILPAGWAFGMILVGIAADVVPLALAAHVLFGRRKQEHAQPARVDY